MENLENKGLESYHDFVEAWERLYDGFTAKDSQFNLGTEGGQRAYMTAIRNTTQEFMRLMDQVENSASLSPEDKEKALRRVDAARRALEGGQEKVLDIP